MAGPEHHRGGVGAAVSDPARTARTAAAKAGGVLATTAPGVSTRTVRLAAAGLWTKASSLASSLRVAAAAPFAKVALVAVLAVIAAPPRGALAAPAQPTATTRELFAFASLAQAAYARSSPPNDAAGAFTLRTTSPTTQYYNFAEGTNNATDDSNGNATTLAGQLTEALGAAMPGWEALSATRKVFGPNALVHGELIIPLDEDDIEGGGNLTVPFLSFRGSVNLLNWITNARSQNLTACTLGAGANASGASGAGLIAGGDGTILGNGEGEGGGEELCCARGFWESYERWLQPFVLEWAAANAAEPDAPVLITGHSLGGAYAVFAAADTLVSQLPTGGDATNATTNANVTMATYNAPRAGTEDLAALVDSMAWRSIRLQTFPEVVSTLPFRANFNNDPPPACEGQVPTHAGQKYAVYLELENSADPPAFPNWTVTPGPLVCTTGNFSDSQFPGFFGVTDWWRRAYNSSLAATADAAHGFFAYGNDAQAPAPDPDANAFLQLAEAVDVTASCAAALPPV